MSTKDQGGFTILSLLVSMAMFTLVMSAFADLTLINNKAQKGLEIRNDFSEFSNNLQQIMATETLCTPALQGAIYNELLVIKDPLASTRTLARAGDLHSTGWSVKSLSFQDLTPVPGYANTWRGTLLIEGTRNTKVALGGPGLSRTILSVFFTLNADQTTINHCYGTSTAWMSTSPSSPDPCTLWTDQGNHYGSDGNNVHCSDSNHTGTES